MDNETLIIGALRTAAVQYQIDAELMRKEGAKSVMEQFARLQLAAIALADQIEGNGLAAVVGRRTEV